MDSSCAAGGGVNLSSNITIINDKYNCGNTGIILHDFAIDGSGITTMSCTSCTGGPTDTAIGISLAALTDVKIYNLYLSDIAQDGIFLKNGGVRTEVHHNTINKCGKLWGNAGCINVEMHTGAANAANNPGTVNISDNVINVTGPDFCDADFHVSCAQDSDCAGVGGVCAIGGGGSAVNGIQVVWTSDAGGTVPGKAIIARNRLELSDNHTGINTVGIQGGEIIDNRMAAFDSGTLMTQVYAGIIVQGATATVVRDALDTIIAGNVILGAGVANDRRPLLVSGSGATSARIKVNNNIFTNRNLRSSFLGAVEFRGVGGGDSEIIGNTIQNIAGNHALIVGNSTGSAGDVADTKVLNNTISDVTTASRDCIGINNATRTAIEGNVFRNCPRAIEIRARTISGTYIGPT